MEGKYLPFESKNSSILGIPLASSTVSAEFTYHLQLWIADSYAQKYQPKKKNV
jgi:hypothetical protein